MTANKHFHPTHRATEVTPPPSRGGDRPGTEGSGRPKSRESNKPAVELDLKGLMFSEKWDVIGATTPAAYARAECPVSPLCGWNHDAYQFQGMVASLKMKNGDLCRRSQVRAAAASMPVLESDIKRQQKYLKEPGSPFRVLCKSDGGKKALVIEAIPPPDHLALVEEGLEELHQGQFNKDWRQQHANSMKSAGPRKSIAVRAENARQQVLKKAAENAMSPMEAQIHISEFRRWCMDKWDDAEYAWNTLNPAGVESLNEEDFVTALRHHQYPKDEAGCRKLFQCFKKEAITESSFMTALDSVQCGRTQRSKSCIFTPKSLALGSSCGTMDPVEALAMSGDLVVSKQDKIERIIQRLRRTDPPIAELLDFMFNYFGTLKTAFKQLDLNGNGDLSNQEFVDGLLRIKSKGNGLGPIEVHCHNLFKRLDPANSGSIRLDDLVKNLESDDDVIIVRFGKFLEEVKKRRKDKAAADREESMKLNVYARMFKVGAAHDLITPGIFLDALQQLRYPTWHANELFKRLDKDDSGELSLTEFTAFLQQDIPVKIQHKEVEPLGNAHRVEQAQHFFEIKCATSLKLKDSNRRNHTEAPSSDGPRRRGGIKLDNSTLLEKLRERSNNEAADLLKSGYQFENGVVKRPDWLSFVDVGMQENRMKGSACGFRSCPKPTELTTTGKHMLRVNREAAPMRDLCGMHCAMTTFNENAKRSFINF